MTQNPIPAYAYGQNPSSVPKLIQVDATGNVIPSNATTVAAALAAAAAIAEGAVATGAAIISTGLVLFNVAGGPVEVVELISICQTANDTTASTLQYQSAGTLGATTQTVSGASASLASAAAGTSVIMQGTALATAPIVNANGAGISAVPGSIIVPAGSIKAVVGVGSTTGTWKHFLRYRPLVPGAVVTAAF